LEDVHDEDGFQTNSNISWMFPTIVILFPHISIVSCIDFLIFDFPKASKTVWNFPFDPSYWLNG
jgi:hypothetical protein